MEYKRDPWTTILALRNQFYFRFSINDFTLHSVALDGKVGE